MLGVILQKPLKGYWWPMLQFAYLAMNGRVTWTMSPMPSIQIYLLLMFMSCQVILHPALPLHVSEKGKKVAMLSFLSWELASCSSWIVGWVTKEKWNVKVETKFIGWTQTLPISLATAFPCACMLGRVLGFDAKREQRKSAANSQMPNVASWIALMWLLIWIYQRTSGYSGQTTRSTAKEWPGHNTTCLSGWPFTFQAPDCLNIYCTTMGTLNHFQDCSKWQYSTVNLKLTKTGSCQIKQ